METSDSWKHTAMNVAGHRRWKSKVWHGQLRTHITFQQRDTTQKVEHQVRFNSIVIHIDFVNYLFFKILFCKLRQIYTEIIYINKSRTFIIALSLKKNNLLSLYKISTTLISIIRITIEFNFSINVTIVNNFPNFPSRVTPPPRKKHVHVYKVGAAIEEGPSFNSRGPLSGTAAEKSLQPIFVRDKHVVR